MYTKANGKTNCMNFFYFPNFANKSKGVDRDSNPGPQDGTQFHLLKMLHKENTYLLMFNFQSFQFLLLSFKLSAKD